MGNPLLLDPKEAALAARKEAILAHAEKVFADNGFSGATMAQIAECCGYSPGHLYNLFESKEELFQEVIEVRASDFCARLQDVLEEPGIPIEEHLSKLIREFLSQVEQQQDFIKIYIQAISGFEWNVSQLGNALISTHAEIEVSLEKCFQQALPKKYPPHQNPSTLSCVVLGTLHRFIARWIQKEGTISDLRDSEPALAATLMHLVAKE
jgi:AcrR family transcriptional regulator